MSNLREVFFQAVSNSSWANEGYLVAVDIDTSNDNLIQKLTRLSNSFGIGVIKLNIEDPSLSHILTPAKKSEEIDGDTINNLYEINKDFQEFIAVVESAVKINRIVYYNLDEIKSKTELKKVLESSAEVTSNINREAEQDLHTNDGRVEIMDWASNVTGKKPKSITINNQEFEATSWKAVYITFCHYLCTIDIEKFKNIKLKGKKREGFSNTDKELRVPYYLEEADVYIEINLAAQRILNIIKSLMNDFGIDQKSVTIELEKD